MTTAENQIYSLATWVEGQLQKRMFPVEVIYGPERAQRNGYFGGVIVVERDRDADDTLGPALAQHRNAKMMGVRYCAIKVTFYAKSGLEGATIAEHEFDCEQFVDAWLVAQQEWGTGSAAGFIELKGARYIPAKERAAAAAAALPSDSRTQVAVLEQWAGCVYEMKFVVPRGVRAVTYYEQARATGSAAAVGGQINVEMAGRTTEIVPMP